MTKPSEQRSINCQFHNINPPGIQRPSQRAQAKRPPIQGGRFALQLN
jgi:hypothetical protein